MSEQRDGPVEMPVTPERYGVFLTPDPVTCGAVATVTAMIRAQYGFVSAGAFPPHATLAGSLPLAVPAEELLVALDEVLRETTSFPVQNAGVRRLGEIVVYDVNDLDGVPNAGLRTLASAVQAAVRPLLQPTAGLAADLHDGDDFHAHLSLASHELFERSDLRHEVAEFAAALPVPVPERFPGDTVTLYRFHHPTWQGPWWQAMRWEHVRTWHLQP